MLFYDKITDEVTDGFTIMVNLEEAIHAEDTNLNSFISFHSSFRGPTTSGGSSP